MWQRFHMNDNVYIIFLKLIENNFHSALKHNQRQYEYKSQKCFYLNHKIQIYVYLKVNILKTAIN
jgi:hypothetical protein